MADSIPVVLGRNVRAIREHHGLTMADVAKEVRSYGVKWSTGRLTQVEHGEGAATIQLLLVLALTLSDLTGEKVTPELLLTTDADVQLTPDQELTGQAFTDVFAGRTTTLLAHDIPEGVQQASETVQRVLETNSVLGDILGGDVTFGAIRAANKARTLADERAARKLGLTDTEFLAWSVRLWGKMMSAEVEERAEPGATPQKKGRITRQLMDEMRGAVDRGHD